jgi:hypothetical protein
MKGKNGIPEEYQDLDLGGREDVLVSESVEREYIEHNGKLFWFDFTEMTWDQKTDIIDANLDVDQNSGEMDLNMKGYYRDVMEEVIVDSSIDGSITTMLRGMGASFGQKLQALDAVPQPGAVMEDVEEGKSEQQSEDET